MNEASSRVRMDPRGVVANDPWRLVQTRYERERAARDETLFSLANGALGVRGGFEEADSPTDGSFLAAAFEQNPIHYHERVPGFARSTDTRGPASTRATLERRCWTGNPRSSSPSRKGASKSQ